MKKLLFFWLILNSTYGQSINASLTIYKNGFTLVKQPVFWNISEGKSEINYSLVPNQLYPETPFLSLEGDAKIVSQRLNDNIFSSEVFFKSHHPSGNIIIMFALKQIPVRKFPQHGEFSA